MPNCDFYATLEDHKILLDKLFFENECEVFELSSDYEKPLKQFTTSEQVLNEFNRHWPNGEKWTSVYLQLNILNCGSELIPKKVNLNPDKCDGFTYRYTAEGLGLVQVYLQIPVDMSLSNSHTNHNSRKRAEAWAKTEDAKTDVAKCNFEKITKFSSKLNRIIQQNSVAKLSSRPVLPGAYELWNKGVSLGPYKNGQHEIILK